MNKEMLEQERLDVVHICTPHYLHTEMILAALDKDIHVLCEKPMCIKAEDIPHAFDRFYKARNEKNKSGSGLGLAIAKQIALRHNMSLELESEQGVYTKITVNLPPKENV